MYISFIVLQFFPINKGFQDVYTIHYVYVQVSTGIQYLLKFAFTLISRTVASPFLNFGYVTAICSVPSCFFLFSRWRLQLKCMIAMTCLLQARKLDINKGDTVEQI